MADNDGDKITPVLDFHPFVFLILGLDAEWTRKQSWTNEPAFKRVFAEIDRIALAAKKKLNPSPLLDQLYKPVNYLPVGHADALSLVVLDDFEPLHEITAQATTTLEEVGVGFCPRIKPIVQELKKKGGSLPDCFCEPEEMVQRCHSDEAPPLLMFTRFKLNGWGSLGHGLLFEGALIRAMVREIGRTMQTLTTEVEQRQNPALKDFQIGLEELKATKFCLLDLQGQEELAIWCTTTNYSVPMAVLARIQALTIRNVFEADSTHQLRNRVNESKWFEQVKKFSADMVPARGETAEASRFESTEHLDASHIFRWTRSTVGITPKAYENPDQVRGYVHAVSVLQAAPGHQGEVDDTLDHLRSELRKEETLPVPRKTPFHLHAMGQGDLLLQHRGFMVRDSKMLVAAAIFFRQVRCCMEAFINKTQKLHGRRDLVGLSSVAGVPVPVLKRKGRREDYLCPKVPKNHQSTLERILPVLRWRIAPDGAPDGVDCRQCLKSGHKLNPETAGGLSLQKIRRQPNSYSLPSSLMHALEYLYQNYATLLANPFVFDSVLDLYDSFATLHRMLTKVLIPQGQVSDSSPAPSLHFTKVSELAKFVGTLRLALEHRLYRAYPEELHRDMDIDFRGGMNQMIFSADAVLKCAVGVLRNNVLKQSKHLRDRVGVVLRVEFRPGIWVVKPELSPEQEDDQQNKARRLPASARLATIITDVPHVYHVPSYLDFLHEAFHLIYDELRSPTMDRADDSNRKRKPPCDFLPTVTANSRLDVRLSELFVNLLTGLFVCRDDPELLAKHYFVQYSASAQAGSANELQTIAQFVEIAASSFLTVRVMRAMTASKEGHWWLESNSDLGDRVKEGLPSTAEAYNQFKPFLEKTAGPLFSEWEKNWLSKDAQLTKSLWEFTEGSFCDYYRVVQRFAPLLAETARAVYLSYVQLALNPTTTVKTPALTEVDVQKWQEWELAIDNFIKDEGCREKGSFGAPLPLGLWQLNRNPREAMLVVSRYLRHIITIRLQRLEACGDKGRFLPPLDEEGDPMFPKDKKFSTVLIQHGSNFFWCRDPAARRERAQELICALKTFWDISTALRASRFGEMLERNMSRPAGQATK